MSERIGVPANANATLLGGRWNSDPDAARGYDQNRLADAMYWLAHGDGGRPLMRLETLQLALAGGLLCELILAEKVAFWDGAEGGALDRAVVINDVPPDDELSAFLYSEVKKDAFVRLGTWLLAIRRQVIDEVRARLNLEQPMPRRGALRARRTTYAPTGMKADRPAAALTMRIHRHEPLSAADGVLIGIGMATGLRRHLLEGGPPGSREHAYSSVAALPPALGAVVAQTEATVAAEATRPPN